MNKVISNFRSLTSSSIFILFAPTWVGFKTLRRIIYEVFIRIISCDCSESGEYLILKRLFDALDCANITYSQLVVDIGVNDGIRGSHSRNFILRDWSAILVDPNPLCIDKVKRLYKRFPKVLYSPLAVSDQSVDLYLRRSAYHSFDGGAMLVSQIDPPDKSNLYVPVHSTRLDTLLSSFEIASNKIGVLSIDTEGFDSKVISGIGNYRPVVIITERGRPLFERLTERYNLLSSLGYVLLYRTYSNDIYLLGQIADSLPLFQL